MNPLEMRRSVYGTYMNQETMFMPIHHLMVLMQTISGSLGKWRGFRSNTNPCDAWMYQEIIHKTKPEVIIEIGNERGGTMVMLKDFMHITQGYGCVIGIDISREEMDPGVRKEDDLYFIDGDAKDPKVQDAVEAVLRHRDSDRVMIIDDSEHGIVHTLAMLRLYSKYVTPGCYFVVEDTILNNGVQNATRKVHVRPIEAVRQFVAENDDFEIDRTPEYFYITNNPEGFLLCTRGVSDDTSV
jgi:cephalosporin hydroxylase